MIRLLLILGLLSVQLTVMGQLPNGSTAPDFTLTDYDGTEHNLYSYLDAGKTVFIKVFAAHCPSCWSYHQTNRLKNLYQDYGPNGTDELMIFALEHDQWNGHDAFVGIGDPWNTQGNWLDGTPFPIFDVENADRSVFDDYNVTYYPLIYKVCPDRSLEQVYTSETEAQLHQKVQACNNSVSVEELEDEHLFYLDPSSKRLTINRTSAVQRLRVLDVAGALILEKDVSNQAQISLSNLKSGVYLFELSNGKETVVERFYLQ